MQNYGHIIVDECHQISAFSFEQVLKACKAKYILGLTATPKRRDGHHPIILMQCGPIVEPPKDLTSQAQTIHKELCVKHTSFTLPSHVANPSINEVYKALTNDNARNELIVQDVISAVSNGGFPLVLTERIEHIEVLKQLLSSSSYPIIVLKGGMRAKERRTALAQLTENSSPRILLATGRYIGEGFDDAPLDSLSFSPYQFRGREHCNNTLGVYTDTTRIKPAWLFTTTWTTQSQSCIACFERDCEDTRPWDIKPLADQSKPSLIQTAIVRSEQ